MTNRLYPEKPGVIPGKPVPLFANLPLATANKFRRIAAQHAHASGQEVNCGKLTKLQAQLVIGACDAGKQLEQHGRSVSFRIGGARW